MTNSKTCCIQSDCATDTLPHFSQICPSPLNVRPYTLTAVLILIARTFIIVPIQSPHTCMALQLALQWSEQKNFVEMHIIWHAKIHRYCPLRCILASIWHSIRNVTLNCYIWLCKPPVFCQSLTHFVHLRPEVWPILLSRSPKLFSCWEDMLCTNYVVFLSILT